MEVKDADKVVVAKPVASRPLSNSRSFSNLLANAINASPSTSLAEAKAAIRPKTLRFRPSLNYSPAEPVSSLDDVSESVPSYPSENASARTWNSDCQSSFIFKPMAKLVSRTTASLLANLGNFDASRQQTLAEVQSQVQVLDQAKNQCVHTQPTSSPHRNLPSRLGEIHINEPSNSVPPNMEQDMRAQQPTNGGGRPSYDGYNWRKYGQKQVKGSEYPRSYYKCTHPKCPVKKKVERSLDGQIAEIVYEGQHNHPKTQPSKRISSGSERPSNVPDVNERDSGHLLWSTPQMEWNERSGSDGRMENHNEVGLLGTPTCCGNVQLSHDSLIASAYNYCTGAPNTSGGLIGDFEVGRGAADADNEKPNSKRRRTMDQASGAGAVTQGVPEPNSVVQTSVESNVSGDGFRWRKYGQKVVKGNSYPRSYYKCTSLKCNARKHIERASDDPRSCITTYEGKHNHDMPVRNLNLVASDLDSLALNKA